MGEHTSAPQAPIQVQETEARWYPEQDCRFKTWSLCNFTLQESMALAYVKELNDVLSNIINNLTGLDHRRRTRRRWLPSQ
jgi:hypothetical protein